jgi:M6 family metalloprotease-like protein
VIGPIPGRATTVAVVAFLGPFCGGSRLAGQDIEAVAHMRGITLPAAYYARVARDPRAFTLPNGLFTTGADGRARPAAGIQGTKRVAVVPALFSDSPEPHVSAEEIQQAIFDGPAARGTLTEAYLEMSRGALTVTGEVAPWVRTAITRAEVVAESNGLGEDARVGEFLLQALALADPGIDFGLYDNDGPDGVPNSGDDNGFVDAIAFEFIEIAASCGGPGIWPHLWGISPQNDGQPYFTDDLTPDGEPVRIDAYIIQSAVDCGGVEIQDAATIAHEFGHVLGLPDYYHPTAPGGADGRRWVLGCWELMAAGSWGCGPVGSTREPFGPTHLSARSKNALDWLSYVTIAPDARDLSVELGPVQESGEALRIALDDSGREYLLVEYRARTGFDAQLPAAGLMIYHQDFQGMFRPDPTSTTPYFMSVVEQDDNDGLLRNSYEGGNRGEATDAWGADGVEQKLNGLTSPSTRRHDGTASTVAFHSLVVEGGKARIRLSTARTPEIAAPGEPIQVTRIAEFERRLRITGGAMPYRVEGSLPDGVSAAAQQDDLVLTGSLDADGPFELSLRVTDDGGLTSPQLLVPLSIGEWLVGEDRLLQLFLESDAEPLDAAERSYLDYVGNRNGRYDVGDLRAWLRAHPGN